jgi:predicted nucleic acid-binding Zn ribbon protein
MAKATSLDSFGAILSGLAKRLGLETRLLELRLQHHWHDIIGEPIASHTWPAQIRFKKLYLVVHNSVWLQQLTFLKPTLLAKVRDAAGTELIGEIVLRVGEIPSPRSVPAAASPDGNLSEVQMDPDTASHTTGIQDLDIRERFTRVISRYPSR